jgi:hypothetical protein
MLQILTPQVLGQSPDQAPAAACLGKPGRSRRLAIKRKTRPMLGFKSFWPAAVTLAGIELMHMIRTGQLLLTGELCPARQFYSLSE